MKIGEQGSFHSDLSQLILSSNSTRLELGHRCYIEIYIYRMESVSYDISYKNLKVVRVSDLTLKTSFLNDPFNDSTKKTFRLHLVQCVRNTDLKEIKFSDPHLYST
jgi:hypothetical protein